MPRRYIAMICVLLFIFLLAPQAAQTYVQEESIKERVKPAIEAGVEFLRRAQTRSGAWQFNDPNMGPNDKDVIGATALAGIALMECNVPVSNSQVQAAAKIVRGAALSLNYNYSMCLCLLFLDRLNRGNPINHRDSGTIKTLANSIAGGQAANGGWGYTMRSGTTDNSNTQFAIVALWVARKYSPNQTKNIDFALQKAAQKFRDSQHEDGGWAYDPTQVTGFSFKSTGSMTCAGVLGLSLLAGVKQQQHDAVFQGQGGNATSGGFVNKLDLDPAIMRARAFIMSAFDNQIKGIAAEDITSSLHITYFFWSLERTATLLKWGKKNGFDWFERGAVYLMSKQSRDGSWSMGSQGQVVDTAFVLLYLAQSNLLGNLTESTLTGGAIGDGPVISKDKKPDTKPLNTKEQAKALIDRLVKALPNQQADILAEITEGNGNDYTYELADAIANKLTSNQSKEAAREALANRLQKKSVKTLGDYMQDPDRELRLAATVAARLKNDTTAAGSLIPLLADQDIGVSTAALDSLKAISGQDFGKSVERWSRWLDKANIKKP